MSGFTTVLLLYLWGDEYWYERYNVPDYLGESQKITKVIRIHWPSVIIGLAFILFAVIYKKLFAQSNAGFPWYFIYLTIVALIPSMVLYHSVRTFINWRAFSFTFFVMVLISLIWEVTLALPYQWWGFQDRAMIGVFISAWQHLPIEEIVVWFSVSYASVIVYETLKIWLISKNTFSQHFLARKPAK